MCSHSDLEQCISYQMTIIKQNYLISYTGFEISRNFAISIINYCMKCNILLPQTQNVTEE